MALLDSIKKNWAAVVVIGGIMGVTYYTIDVIDTRAADVAKKEDQRRKQTSMA